MKSKRGRRLAQLVLPVASVVFLKVSGAPLEEAQASEPPVALSDIDEHRELLIVHPTVVDPYLNDRRSHNGSQTLEGGSWSVRRLLEDIARHANGGAVPNSGFMSQFLGSIFESWLSDRTLPNGQVLPARDLNRVRSLLLDEFSSVDPGTGQRNYQLWKAPFELIAIVNRADLAAASGSDAGELRFVFKLAPGSAGDQKLTFIVEYKVAVTVWNKTTWAHQWHKLSSLPVGSDAYLRHLESITNHATRWVPNMPPLARRVSQIRTNEIALAPDSDQRWEMREFRPSANGFLVPAQPFNAPDPTLNNGDALARFAACTPELAETNAQNNGAARELVIPAVFTDCNDPNYQVSLLGPRALVGQAWTIPGASAVTTDNFGMLTCNGCHNDHAAPKAFDFYHISPELPENATVAERLSGEGRLSLFLTEDRPEADGVTVAPSELQRRKALQVERLLTACTNDVCLAGTQCTVDADCPASPSWVTCNNGRCGRPAHCGNWSKDIADGESGPDCGGDCAPCNYGQSCFETIDCMSGASCLQGVCTP